MHCCNDLIAASDMNALLGEGFDDEWGIKTDVAVDVPNDLIEIPIGDYGGK
jgi:hypothetical protein